MRRKIRVKRHIRKDGTVVRGHSRKIILKKHPWKHRITDDTKFVDDVDMQYIANSKRSVENQIYGVNELRGEEHEEVRDLKTMRFLLILHWKDGKKIPQERLDEYFTRLSTLKKAAANSTGFVYGAKKEIYTKEEYYGK